MAKYQLEIPHALTPEEVRARLGRATSKLESQYGARCTWQGDDQLLVARKGLEATVHVEPQRVRIDLELGFMMSALSGTIRSGITRQLTELLS